MQLCPDAQVDDGMLDVTYIINPELAQARHHPWRRGLKWLLQRAAVSTILIPMQLSVPYLAFSVVYQIPTILGDLQNDKRLDGPKGQIRCSWLEVECPDELQVIFGEVSQCVLRHASAQPTFVRKCYTLQRHLHWSILAIPRAIFWSTQQHCRESARPPPLHASQVIPWRYHRQQVLVHLIALLHGRTPGAW